MAKASVSPTTTSLATQKKICL